MSFAWWSLFAFGLWSLRSFARARWAAWAGTSFGVTMELARQHGQNTFRISFGF